MSIINEATIKVRRDSASNWTTSNPTPLQGEWCYETDTGKVKIGDGSTAWTSLDYQPTLAEVNAKASLSTYSTGWVANSDWTNKEFTVTHNFGTNLSDLIVKFFISTDGTEANGTQVDFSTNYESGTQGINPMAINNNSFKIQTGDIGFNVTTDDGTRKLIDTESYYYKVKVYKLV